MSDRFVWDSAEVRWEDRPPCLCGCGATPKRKKSRFVPGHDARFHAAMKKAPPEANPEPAEKPTGTKRPRRPSQAVPVKDGATKGRGSKP